MPFSTGLLQVAALRLKRPGETPLSSGRPGTGCVRVDETNLRTLLTGLYGPTVKSMRRED